MTRRRRWPRLAALALAVLAFAWLAAGGSRSSDEGDVEVERGDLVLGVEVTGKLESISSDLLGPPQIPNMWSYKIAFLAPEGSEVRAGQPVLGFDTSELERTLLAKIAERDSADTELEKRQTDLERQRRDSELALAEARAKRRRAELKTEVPPELAARSELAEARLDLELAGREVAHLEEKLRFEERRARAELGALAEKRNRAAVRVREIEGQLRRMRVAAPRGGTVIYVESNGEKKKVGDQVWQQAKVLEIPDLTQMMAEGEVDESDVGRIRPGQPVTLRLDAHPDVEYRGRVRRIGNAVEQRSRRNPVKVIGVEIELEATDALRMRPGMRFRGTVETERVADVLLIPLAAVDTRSDGPVVYRRRLFGSEEVRPELGRRNGAMVEVLGGLAAGDRLARHPPEEG